MWKYLKKFGVEKKKASERKLNIVATYSGCRKKRRKSRCA
jgi:hypothetical protein